jgi:hypothetical protein
MTAPYGHTPEIYFLPLKILDNRHNALPAATAETKRSAAAAAANQFAHAEHGDAGTRRAIGMTERDSTAVGIPVIHIDPTPHSRIIFPAP